MSTRSAGRYATLLGVFGILVVACGGGGTSTPSNPGPVLTNLQAALVAASCRLTFTSGTVLRVTTRFQDRDGDVARMMVTGTFDTGTSFDFSVTPRLDGTIKGTATADFCIRFGAFSQSVTVSAALVDDAGHSSNVLSAVVRRPGTLRPRGTENDPGAPLLSPLQG